MIDKAKRTGGQKDPGHIAYKAVRSITRGGGETHTSEPPYPSARHRATGGDGGVTALMVSYEEDGAL